MAVFLNPVNGRKLRHPDFGDARLEKAVDSVHMMVEWLSDCIVASGNDRDENDMFKS